MAPLVNILINNYNFDQFDREAIESSLRQTFDNIGILAVSDGSPAIIKSYGLRVKGLLQEDGWQASAFNDRHCRELQRHHLFTSCRRLVLTEQGRSNSGNLRALGQIKSYGATRRHRGRGARFARETNDILILYGRQVVQRDEVEEFWRRACTSGRQSNSYRMTIFATKRPDLAEECRSSIGFPRGATTKTVHCQ